MACDLFVFVRTTDLTSSFHVHSEALQQNHTNDLYFMNGGIYFIHDQVLVNAMVLLLFFLHWWLEMNLKTMCVGQ